METVAGMNTLSYLGVTAPNPPNIIKALRAPTTNDKKYNIGDMWINTATSTAYQLVDIDGSGADWQVTGSPSSAVSSLAGDTGSAAPAAGVITIAGGTNITSAASGSTVTINLDAVLAGLTSVAATTFTTNVAAAQLSLSGTAIAAIGTDANINLDLTPKGTGDLRVTVGDVLAQAGDVIASRSAAGADVTVEATNSDNTSGTSNAFFEAAVGGTSSGDSGIRFQISGGQNWGMGIDNSDSDALVLSESNTLGTNNAFRVAPTTRDMSVYGNLILPTAAKQLQMEGGAVTDFIGQATLTAGTVTVLNTNIAAGDKIMVSRQGINGSTALGVFDVAITPATSFSITARNPTDATTQTNDVSIVDYFIVRQL